MSDVFSKAKRSEIMSKVRATETKPEIKIRKFLFSKGFRYRKNSKSLPGKPDIVLPKFKTVVFVNGCFWHGHKNCDGATLPKSNQVYWKNKIGSNIRRDKKKISELKKLGWNVIVVWECKIRKILVPNSRNQLSILNLIRKNNL